MSALAWTIAAAGVGVSLAALARGRGAAATLPVDDAGSLDGPCRRSRALWLALAVAVAALLAAFALAEPAHTGARPVLPTGSAAIVVLDVSSSTRSSSTSISRVLRGVASDTRRRLGLVLFSNTAYEALPPTTPADGLQGWLDRFARDDRGTNPWASFSGGTSISSGLLLAHRLLGRHPAEAHVVLVSDLADAGSDVARLQGVVALYQREGIDLRIVDLARYSGSRRAPDLGFLEHAATATVEPSRPAGGGSPYLTLAVLVVAAALVTAVHELAFHPFSWRPAT